MTEYEEKVWSWFVESMKRYMHALRTFSQTWKQEFFYWKIYFCWPCWADVRLCKHTTGKNSTNFGYRHHNLNHANLSRNKNRSTLLDDNDNDNANESSIHSPRLNNLGNSFTICLLFIGRASFSCIFIGNFNVIWSMIDKIWIYFYSIVLKLSR